MTTTVISLLLTAGAAISIIYLFLHHYRKLRQYRQRCDTAFKDVEILQAQLISRSAPIILITQKVLRDEAQLFTDIRNMSDTDIERTQEARVHAILLFRNKIKHLYKRSLKNPELKADPALIPLWTKIEITNRNIDESASYYNDAVHDYGELVSKFPASMLADIMHYPQYHRI